MFGIPMEAIWAILGAIVPVLLHRNGIKVPGIDPTKPIDPNLPSEPNGGLDLNGDGKTGPIELIIEKTMGKLLARLMGKTAEETHMNVQMLLKK